MGSAVNPSPRSSEGTETSGQASGRGSRAVVAEQRDRFGGMKVGACFFGWLTATGTAVLLTAGGIVVAIVVAVVALLGAVAGGLAGMRFHRRVDRATHDAAR